MAYDTQWVDSGANVSDGVSRFGPRDTLARRRNWRLREIVRPPWAQESLAVGHLFLEKVFGATDQLITQAQELRHKLEADL